VQPVQLVEALLVEDRRRRLHPVEVEAGHDLVRREHLLGVG